MIVRLPWWRRHLPLLAYFVLWPWGLFGLLVPVAIFGLGSNPVSAAIGSVFYYLSWRGLRWVERRSLPVTSWRYGWTLAASLFGALHMWTLLLQDTIQRIYRWWYDDYSVEALNNMIGPGRFLHNLITPVFFFTGTFIVLPLWFWMVARRYPKASRIVKAYAWVSMLSVSLMSLAILMRMDYCAIIDHFFPKQYCTGGFSL